MANLLEVLVTSDLNNNLSSCTVWDPNTGSSLMTYRGGGTAETKCLTFIGKDYLAAVEKGKPVLHVWPINSQQTVQGMRFILPGKASAFAVTPDGFYSGAAVAEKIYVWQTSSGNLLTIISRHYQKIVVLKFTPDGKFLVSAAEDGMVMVWSLPAVAVHSEVELVSQTRAGQHDAIYTFSDHSLPVTDLYISKTGMNGRLCSVSSDKTCKVYDLTTGELLLNLVFDSPLTAVTMDVLELSVFVGSSVGNIYQFSLTSPPRNRDLLVDSETAPVFLSHSKEVTCLSVSMNGELLMSGSNDEKVILWHIRSKQPKAVIQHKGPITNGFFTTNNASIYKQDFKPHIILHSLQKTLERDGDDNNEIEVVTNTKIDFWPVNNVNYVQTTSPTESEIEYKKKAEKLQSELEALKNINSSLYEFSIEKVISSISDASNKKFKRKNN